MIGTVLLEKYEIEKKIGEGGFGTVYQAVDMKLKRPVAVKILTAGGVNSSARERLIREAETLARINHPNIVTVFDCGDFEGKTFLVMEHIHGPSLEEFIGKGSLTISQECSLALQVCKAMLCAHGQGVIHRDLTLKNIMLDTASGEGARVKILDFGLVKLVNTSIQTTGNTMMGTPSYISPEQILGEPVDERTDIFSFGVCLFRILNGYFPFEAEHPAALMYSIVNESNLEFVDEVPTDFKTVIRRCLEKSPNKRYSDFNELADDLATLLKKYADDESAVIASLPDVKAFAKRSSKRNPYLNRVMIKNPVDLVGRSKEVRKIYSRLDAPHPQSISVVGERRIGKSSLLNFIYNRRNRKQNMQHYENAIFVYLDFQRNVDFDVPKFIDFLFNVFSFETQDSEGYSGRDRTLDQLKEVVQELHDQGNRIIVLMDEFEVITKNEKFEEDFFSFLRSLANSYHVAYVTSSCEELQLMCHNKDISDSPFFNIFSNLPLRAFSRDEAVELITDPSEREGIPLGAHAGRIIELAGYFPLFLQIACSNVFEFLLDNPDSEPDWEQIARSYIDEVSPHYQFLWERMNEEERENLGRIASGKSISKKYQFVNEDLMRRGYLLASDGEYSICSKTLNDFILAQQAGGTEGGSFLSSLFRRR
ncbi:MAG: protein kinase [bacterium]|nr:MAG: protein kinase [bacterium]